jgi:hypothetical protein
MGCRTAQHRQTARGEHGSACPWSETTGDGKAYAAEEEALVHHSVEVTWRLLWLGNSSVRQRLGGLLGAARPVVA